MSDIVWPMDGSSGSRPDTIVIEAPAPGVERSPSDLLRLVVAIVLLASLLVVQALFGDALVSFAGDLLGGLEALPHWIVYTLVVGTRVLAIVVIGGGLVVTLWHARLRMLVTVAAAGLIALGLAVLLDTFAPGSGAEVVNVDNDLVGPLTAAGFPSSSGVAVVTAVLTAAAPWLSRRWRRIGWLLVIGVILTRFLSSPVSFDSLRNALVGWVAGAGVLVLLGGPRRRPSGEALADGLAAVGVPLARLEQASVDARGSTPYFGTGADGRPLFVKALGEDQRSADLLFRVYRWLNRRDLGDERPFSSLRRGVEHEALVALAARATSASAPPDWWRSPPPTRTRSSSRTRPSRAAASIGWSPTRSRTPCSRRSGSRWAACGSTASRIATCAWPTSSWRPTVRCG